MTDQQEAPVTTLDPYQAWKVYWINGWRGILPLPYGRKTPPPADTTGYEGYYPSYADCTAWEEGEGLHNIALRLTDEVVGIDVDHYGDKVGGDTLADLVAKFGALPPTWLSTSRADGISGIRLYRVPKGTVLPTKLPGIDLIQKHHRYVVCWPSIHPEGRLYRWINETTGQIADMPPAVDELPELPTAWIEGLQVDSRQQEKADLTTSEAQAVVNAMPGGDPCQHVLAAAGKAHTPGARHDSYGEALLAVLGAGRRGCPGAPGMVSRLASAFVAEVTADGSRTNTEANAEMRRSIVGAVGIVVTQPQGESCPGDVLDWLDGIEGASQGEGDDEGDSEVDSGEPTPFDIAVRRKYADLLIADAAKQRLAEHKAGEVAPLEGLTLAEFLAQPDEGERYRVEGLWPAEGRVLMPAAAKSGKTTLIVGNLIPALVDGGEFLGRFSVTPVQRRIVLFNLEVGERTLRAWMRRARMDGTDRVTVVNLRGKVSSLGLSTEAGRKRLSEFLAARDAEVAILDPLAPALAAFGLDENSNADIATFFGWWSEALGAAGVVDDLIAHHAGHAGERARGASRLLDEPDAIWTMRKRPNGGDDEPDVLGATEPRFLHAYGRDVDLPAEGLTFDAETGLLTLNGKRESGQAGERIERDVLEFIGSMSGGVTRNKIVEGVTGKKELICKVLDRLVVDGRVQRRSAGQALIHTLSEAPNEA